MVSEQGSVFKNKRIIPVMVKYDKEVTLRLGNIDHLIQSKSAQPGTYFDQCI